MAWKDARQGGPGRANAILVLGLDNLKEVYQSLLVEGRGGPMRVHGHHLDGNVLAILQEVDTPKYQRYLNMPASG